MVVVVTVVVVVAAVVAAVLVVVIRPNILKPCYRECFLLPWIKTCRLGPSHNRFSRNMVKNRTKCQRNITQSMEVKRSGGVVVKELRYKPASRGFDSRWCQDFSP